MTSDSQGENDWVVAVKVKAYDVAYGDFAAAGSSVLSGVTPPNVTSVQITWLGPDGVLDNDDIVFSVPVSGGRFSAQGLPEGAYVVSRDGIDRDVVLDSTQTKVDLTLDELPQAGSNESLIRTVAGLMLVVGFALRKISIKLRD